MFGEREVSQYIDRGVEYAVIFQARAADRNNPQDLKNVFVRTGTGTTVAPRGRERRSSCRSRPSSICRRSPGRSRSTGSIASGRSPFRERPRPACRSARRWTCSSSGEGCPAAGREDRLQRPVERVQADSSSIYVTFGVALLVVFLVLAAQFESWVAPITIMLAVPLASRAASRRCCGQARRSTSTARSA